MKNSKFLRTPTIIGLFYNVLIILACAVVGILTPHRGIALGLMAIGGFFAGMLFITLLVSRFGVKPQDNESPSNQSVKT